MISFGVNTRRAFYSQPKEDFARLVIYSFTYCDLPGAETALVIFVVIFNLTRAYPQLECVNTFLLTFSSCNVLKGAARLLCSLFCVQCSLGRKHFRLDRGSYIFALIFLCNLSTSTFPPTNRWIYSPSRRNRFPYKNKTERIKPPLSTAIMRWFPENLLWFWSGLAGNVDVDV